MSGALQDQFAKAGAAKTPRKDVVQSAPTRPGNKTTRDCPRVTVRFSRDDYERLQELANGASLAVYLRGKALDEQLPRVRGRSAATVKDKAAIAQLLGLLGQSRIANNLNQLAYQANIGALVMDDDARSQIKEAYAHVNEMRGLLIEALGLRA